MEDVFAVTKVIMVRCDNSGTVDYASTPKTISRMKHVTRDENRIREYVKDGSVRIKFIPTKLNYADALTKVLQASRFWALVGKFMWKL